MRTRQIGSVLFLLSCLLPIAQAASPSISAGNPLTMRQHTPAAVKAMAAQIMTKVGLDYSGYIHLDWQDNLLTATAWQLRRELLDRGFSSTQILLLHDAKSNGMLSADNSLRITFLSVSSGPKRCPHNAMDYRFRRSDHLGCVTEELRDASRMYPPDDLF
jgi:hypothetical protein